MSETLTLANHASQIRTLASLLSTHSRLPAVNIALEQVPDGNLHYELGMQVSVHGDWPAFEAWREALAIDPQSLNGHEQSGDTQVVEGFTVYAEARVRLVGYGQLLISDRTAGAS